MRSAIPQPAFSSALAGIPVGRARRSALCPWPRRRAGLPCLPLQDGGRGRRRRGGKWQCGVRRLGYRQALSPLGGFTAGASSGLLQGRSRGAGVRPEPVWVRGRAGGSGRARFKRRRRGPGSEGIGAHAPGWALGCPGGGRHDGSRPRVRRGAGADVCPPLSPPHSRRDPPAPRGFSFGSSRGEVGRGSPVLPSAAVCHQWGVRPPLGDRSAEVAAESREGGGGGCRKATLGRDPASMGGKEGETCRESFSAEPVRLLLKPQHLNQGILIRVYRTRLVKDMCCICRVRGLVVSPFGRYLPIFTPAKQIRC